MKPKYQDEYDDSPPPLPRNPFPFIKKDDGGEKMIKGGRER